MQYYAFLCEFQRPKTSPNRYDKFYVLLALILSLPLFWSSTFYAYSATTGIIFNSILKLLIRWCSFEKSREPKWKLNSNFCTLRYLFPKSLTLVWARKCLVWMQERMVERTRIQETRWNLNILYTTEFIQ